MKIDRITIRYGELRSSGYPSFSNERHETEISALLEEGDVPREIHTELLRLCKIEVLKAFGDNVRSENQMDIPF